MIKPWSKANVPEPENTSPKKKFRYRALENIFWKVLHLYDARV